MAIREFKNKKGITYEVRINYKDKYGLKKYYSKRGFTSKRQAQNHEKIMKAKILQGFEKTNNLTFDEAFMIILLKLTNHSDYADQLFRYP